MKFILSSRKSYIHNGMVLIFLRYKHGILADITMGPNVRPWALINTQFRPANIRCSFTESTETRRIHKDTFSAIYTKACIHFLQCTKDNIKL